MPPATPEAMITKKIKGAMVFPKEASLKFVPHSLLKQILNPDAVKEVLLRHNSRLGPDIIPDLVAFFSERSFKVFAILVLHKRLRLAEHFYQSGFEDHMLPVIHSDSDWEIESYNKEHPSNEQVRSAFLLEDGGPWDENEEEIDDFCHSWQWPFVSPVFIKDKFRYMFPNDIHLPFTGTFERKTSSGLSFYSYVEEKSVHISHLPEDSEAPMDAQGNRRVAIKELRRSGENFESVAEGEAAVLEMMRGFKNEHLVKAIAFYQKGKEYYFMFPWAELGCLDDFWKQSTPRMEQSYIIWVFRQLTGLARAIEVLHHKIAHSNDVNCRHGDLKPANILCFKMKGGQEDTPRLVITDVGLAKLHNLATEWRDQTLSTASTIRYAAPELGINPKAPRSRRFDIWSMGCIFLEFVIWLLYGTRGLQQFSHDLQQSFYEFKTTVNHDKKEEQIAQLHPMVEKYISYIKDDWRCSNGTAIRSLVELIVTRLLKVEVDNSSPRKDSNKHTSSTKGPALDPQMPIPIITGTMTEEPVSISQTSIPTIVEPGAEDQNPNSQPPLESIKRAATWDDMRRSTVDQPPDLHYRAYALEIREKLEDVLAALENETIKAIGDKPSKETPTPLGLSYGRFVEQNGHLGVSNATWHQNLNDDWDYAPDDKIAEIVFTGLEKSLILPLSESSQLCHRCVGLRPWSPDCTFMDSTAGLEDKANKEMCILCKLLLKGLQARVKDPRKFVRFARVGSYLTIDDGQGQAIANLYTMPSSGKTSSDNTQIGFPRLPDAGSETQLKILREWIHYCDSTHQCYPKHINFLPTRLIDVNNKSSGVLRLLDHNRGHTWSGKYVALSHRWGSPPQHVKFCTYKSNIEEFRHGIKVAALPQTFQDAVRITRGLGLQYLWIDSLCIIQDDQSDWEAESKLMERVFSSAYCTIAASCASGSSDGFLKPRLDRGCVAMQGPDVIGPYYVCEAIDDFHLDVDQSELNRRGWVLQERALSRRTIYFTERQLYWECGGGVRCETMTMMKNRKASFLGDADFPNSVETHVKGMRIELFQDLYERYSKLALSFPSDRPIAIKGLEARLLETFDTTGGFGIFDIYLHRCLLWQNSGATLKRIEAFRGGNLVPTWSWMAYDGPIQYTAIPFGQAAWSNDITSPFSKARRQGVLNDNKRESKISAVSKLVLEAPVWELTNTKSERIILDEPSRTLNHPLECIIVGKSKLDSLHERQLHYVLLVCFIESVAGDKLYERVGVGVLEQSHIALNRPQRNAKVR